MPTHTHHVGPAVCYIKWAPKQFHRVLFERNMKRVTQAPWFIVCVSISLARVGCRTRRGLDLVSVRSSGYGETHGHVAVSALGSRARESRVSLSQHVSARRAGAGPGVGARWPTNYLYIEGAVPVTPVSLIRFGAPYRL